MNKSGRKSPLLSAVRRFSLLSRKSGTSPFELFYDFPDGLFTLSKDWKLTYLNKQAELLAGGSSENLIGKNLWESYPLLKGTIVEEKYRLAMRTGEVIRFESQTPYSGDIWFESTLFPNGEGMAVYFRNIDEIRRLKIEAEAQAKELKEANERLERFASQLAHDLSAPLKNINLLLEYVQETLSETRVFTEEEISPLVDRAAVSAAYTAQMIDGLLQIARTRNRNDLNNLETCSIEEILNECIETIASEIKESRAQVEIVDELLEIECDPGLLKIVFQNLILNALRFARPGKFPQITIICKKRKDKRGQVWNAVAVRDGGLGIARERISSIQEAFSRDPNSPGLGLGLAIAKNIIDLHKGRLEIDSELGRGATFTVLIPSRRI